MAPLPFAAIFLDTNICIPAWPDEPAALAELGATAGLFSLPIILPGPVDLELRAHTLRATNHEIENIWKSRNRIPGFLRDRVDVCPLSPDVIASDYDRRAEQTRKALGLEVSPFPAATLLEVFTDAIQMAFPFEEEGRNFQDAVILRSVCESA